MLMIIVAIVTAAIGVGAILGALHFLKRQAAESVGAKRDDLNAQIEKLTAEIDELLKYSRSFISQGQFSAINAKLLEVQEAFEQEKANQ